MKRNKYIIILMVAIILINSIIIPNNTYAVAETAIAVTGSKILAEILVGFVTVMASQGIKFATWEDANKAYNAMENEEIEGFDATPPWRISLGEIEYYMDNGHWSTEEPPPTDNVFSKIFQSVVAGTLAISDFLNIGKSIKNMFGDSNVGENTIENQLPFEDYQFYQNGYHITITNCVPRGTDIYLQGRINDYRNVTLISMVYNNIQRLTSFKINSIEEVDHYLDITISYTLYDEHLGITKDETGFVRRAYDGNKVTEPPNIPQPTNITYNITNNSPIITDTPLPTIPLPQIEKLPQEKIEIIIMPDGTRRVIYDGNIDEIVGIIAETYPIQDMYPKPGSPPYELIETDQKTEIKPVTPTTPFPDPNIEPNPELPENEQDLIPWIQVVINWISETNNSIKDIFIPPEEYVPPELDFEPLKNIVIIDKFPFSLPWDMKYVISQLISDESKAPIFHIDFPIEVSALKWSQDVKFDIDFQPFTPLANIVRTMLSLIFVLGLVILTRTFIGGA